MRSPSNSATNALSAVRWILGQNKIKIHVETNRATERNRRAALTVFSAFVLRAISMAVSILTVRLTFRYLGAERYGMWMTISSAVMMFGFADLGMSNGLINVVAGSIGHGDRLAAKRAIATGFWMLSAVAIALTIAAAVTFPFINAARLFNVHSPAAIRETGLALLVLFVCFILNLPLGTVRGTQVGLQQGFQDNLWSSFGILLSLVALFVAIHNRVGLPILVLSLSAPPLLTLLLNGTDLFLRSNPDLRPSLRAFSRASCGLLFRTGSMYFLLQLSLSVGFQTDNVVIAQILGPQAVAAYAVPARLFNIVTSFLVMLSGSMLPAYADAFARSDGWWIRRTFTRIVWVGTITTAVASSLLVIFGNRILSLWVGPQVRASGMLLAALAMQCVLNAYLQPVSFLLNGAAKFKIQVISGVAMAVLNLALSILFVRLFGILGAVLGTVASILLVQVVPLSIAVKHLLRTFAALESPNLHNQAPAEGKAPSGPLNTIPTVAVTES